MIAMWVKAEDGNSEQTAEDHIAMAMALTRKAGGKILKGGGDER